MATAVEPERTKDRETLREIAVLEDYFAGISSDFKFLDKIGEGTFSCVYRAVDLKHDAWDNSWQSELGSHQVNDNKGVVAIKRIHATSSPTRIANELEILATLADSKYVSHIITALRHRDQVLVVMPYIKFTDPRQIIRVCGGTDARRYMQQLLQGLEFVHDRGVIHRDIKPTNFLFDCETGNGVLVDFGLAEFEQIQEGSCLCSRGGYHGSNALKIQGGYAREDARPSRKANRAGTRGFRAPEVLLRCTRQTCKIDIWAAGVILLMLLSHRFPFFNSVDDSEALVELTTVFGKSKMKQVALLHGAVLETNVPTVWDNGFDFEEIINWCNDGKLQDSEPQSEVDTEQAIDLLRQLLEVDFRRRPSATEALKHPLFKPRS